MMLIDSDCDKPNAVLNVPIISTWKIAFIIGMNAKVIKACTILEHKIDQMGFILCFDAKPKIKPVIRDGRT